MSFSQLISILRARWIIIATVLVVTVAVAVSVSLLLPKQYTADGAVVVDVKSPDPIVGMILPGMASPGYMATQVDIAKSDRVAQKVIRTLRMNESSEMRTRWTDETEGRGNFDSWLAELLQKKLEVKPARESNVISISYTGADPQFASVLANAFIQAYIDTTLDLRVEPAKRFSTLFETQAKQLREDLEDKQSKLSDYQQKNGIVATDERMDVENARLVELSSQLVALQSMSADSVSRKSNAGANSTEVLNNPVVAALKADLSRQEARLRELSARYGTAHPQVVELQANTSELRDRVNAEVGRVTASLTINNTVNTSREGQIRRELEAQRQKLLAMKKQRDDAAVLLRDVENAQRAYELIQARFNQTSLESQSNQTNVSVLKYAAAPVDASFPRLFFNTFLAIVLGTVLALSCALIVELRDRRLRTDFDVIEDLKLPVLATLPRAKLGGETSSSNKKSLLGVSNLKLASPAA